MTTSTQDEISPVQNQEQNHRPTRATRSKAVEFLENHANEETSFTYEEEKAVLRRIDKRVLLLLLWAYFFQQLDKSTLGYRKATHDLCELPIANRYTLNPPVMSLSLASPRMPT